MINDFHRSYRVQIVRKIAGVNYEVKMSSLGFLLQPGHRPRILITHVPKYGESRRPAGIELHCLEEKL